MLKLMTLISFLVLVAHTLVAKTGTLQTANVRAGLALVFIALVLAVLKNEFEDLLDAPRSLRRG